MFEIFAEPGTWISLFTLTLMEIVLGIDNIIFISIVAGKLPPEQQGKARTIGLMCALVFRVILLLFISHIVAMKDPLFTLDLPFGIEDFGVTGRDLILFAGGLFLIAKSTTEIHGKLEGVEDDHTIKKVAHSLSKVIFQIILIDIVFSFDSILTAVGLVEHVTIMIIAVVLSMGVMLAFSKAISDFVNNRPTIKILALAFLIMIGFMLVLEALHQHVPKGYIYFAMAFSLAVELLNQRIRKKAEPVQLRDSIDLD
ncbi:TerC family protein [Adhaeribacter sp. BT258]|uniref:TerC family protein n=1 Tax=Adhaeribacter terrigena TaxID=2793070 RepID=A0ABS1C525_9BACT|nr:TerC family protein [Adhaeribacter terrigena]MBK0404484.1 TerC family protein [Adhaeribacter terrigena]